MKRITRLRLLLRALCSFWRAYKRAQKGRRQMPRSNHVRRQLRRRREAVRLLGGCCSCCGLSLEFLPVLQLHHTHRTGEAHRQILKALSVSIVCHILAERGSPPWPFTVEVLCRNCHEMIHAEGSCPHRRRKGRAA